MHLTDDTFTQNIVGQKFKYHHSSNYKLRHIQHIIDLAKYREKLLNVAQQRKNQL